MMRLSPTTALVHSSARVAWASVWSRARSWLADSCFGELVSQMTVGMPTKETKPSKAMQTMTSQEGEVLGAARGGRRLSSQVGQRINRPDISAGASTGRSQVG